MPGDGENPYTPGLTKREYIAALALQGLFAGDPMWNVEAAALHAVLAADQLIRRLNE